MLSEINLNFPLRNGKWKWFYRVLNTLQEKKIIFWVKMCYKEQFFGNKVVFWAFIIQNFTHNVSKVFFKICLLLRLLCSCIDCVYYLKWNFFLLVETHLLFLFFCVLLVLRFQFCLEVIRAFTAEIFPVFSHFYYIILHHQAVLFRFLL
jgi:hypothetical protein